MSVVPENVVNICSLVHKGGLAGDPFGDLSSDHFAVLSPNAGHHLLSCRWQWVEGATESKCLDGDDELVSHYFSISNLMGPPYLLHQHCLHLR